MGQHQPTPETKIREREKTSTPSLFKVLMHNDDYTTMEFVVDVLQTIFYLNDSAAERTMLAIHFQGVGHCGTFPFAIAETKVQEVCTRARKEGFPLRCSIEKE